MQIRLYNTLTRKIEDFIPIKQNHVGFYSCGPTVYHYAPLGNLKTMVHNDLLKRMFLANGFDVHHVMNITDVGHLTDEDNDSGEDKMERGAARDHKSVWDIAQFYLDEFLRDTDALNIMRPTDMPRATEYIKEQIELIQKLEKLGYTYEIPGDGIYYDTSKFVDYGILTGGSLSGQRAGARVEYNNDKRNPTDFALWKYSPTDVKRQMEWDSPWGIGFPGWHTECCVMSMKLLGNHFDIHTGGEDLSRVHHNNEIAQSEPIVGKPWVHYWIHFGFLLDKSGEKMAKSKGDFLGMNALRDRGIDPIIYRYWVVLGHFQSQMAFSFDALAAAETGYKNLVRKIADLMNDNDDKIDQEIYQQWHDKILSPASDNMKTAESLVVFQDLLKQKDINSATKLALVKFVDELLGLKLIENAQKLHDLESETAPDEIQQLAQKRMEAKKSRDFATADTLRGQIDMAGWTVMDTVDGFKLVKKQ